MPSPFPGMNPFLEGPVWEDFHHEFLSAIRSQLVPQVQPRYEARVELRVYVQMPMESPRSIRPDVSIHRTDDGSAAVSPTIVSVLEPTLVTLVMPEEMQEAFLTIREQESGELVTVIELLSPTNKRPGVGRAEYLTKRSLVLRSDVHLVELDLLRGGERLPALEPLPVADYYAFVSRSWQRPSCELYSWPMRQSLPEIPIPLATEDSDAHLNLKAALDETFDRAGYRLSYDRELDPPLREDDKSWAMQYVK